MAIYILISFFEFFCLNNLLDIISSRYIIHVLVMILCLILINPLLTYYAVGKLPLKPKKRINGSLKEDLKRHTQ